MLQKIWDWAEENLTTEEIINKLFPTDNSGRTILHEAAMRDNVEVLQKIQEWAGKI